MERESGCLQDLITYLEYGTKLHIGVLFLGNYGTPLLTVPFENTIHSSVVCKEMKSRNRGYRRCSRCRGLAIKKAIREQKPFCGICINGVCEYTRPVVVNGETVCIIFIGNLLPKEEEQKRIRYDSSFFSTLESEISLEQCEQMGGLLEQYIRMVMELYPAPLQDSYDSLITGMKGYLEENLEYPMELSHLATVFHYNEKYLGRLFKKKTGCSFHEYLNMRRVERGKELLRKGENTVLWISEQVGFNNVTYFNKMFHRYVGMTPTQYREKRKER